MSFQYDPFSQNNQEEKSDSTAKRAVRTAGNVAKNKVKSKIAKKAIKLAASAAKKGIVVLGKALLAFLGTLGLPAILAIVGIVFLIIIITFVSSALFGGGIGLNDEQQELYDHIVEASNSTVNMNNPEQRPYRVPVQLLSSVIQLEAAQDDDHFQLVTDLAELLAPNFIYSDQFNEYTETQTRSCKEGDCEPWSDIHREDNYVSKLTNIDYWEGHRTFTYNSYVTNWYETVETEYVTEIETVTEKYIDYETRKRERTKYVPEQVTIYEDKVITDVVVHKIPVPFPPWYIEWEQEVKKTVKVPKTVTRYKQVTEEYEEVVPVEKEREVEIEVQKEVKHYTKTRYQLYRRDSHDVTDYTFLDTKLNSLGFGINDKRLLEANYNFQGRTMEYIAWLENSYGGNSGGGYFPPYNPYPGLVTPGEGIPSQFMQHYLAAEAAFGTPWFILASVHAQETQFSTHPTMISSAGAEGHMQVRP
ncbi:hypothetical protein [Oceanobacillus luteolus]|uniref:Peptidase M23 n=1 Tax=Oceanobacillus luteolus TaxID=1274358 RepID=A0ABW4HY52_9BACI